MRKAVKLTFIIHLPAGTRGDVKYAIYKALKGKGYEGKELTVKCDDMYEAPLYEIEELTGLSLVDKVEY